MHIYIVNFCKQYLWQKLTKSKCAHSYTEFKYCAYYYIDSYSSMVKSLFGIYFSFKFLVFMYNFLKPHFFLSFLTFHNFLKCKYFSTLFKTSFFFFPVFSHWFLLLSKFNLQTSLPVHIPQNTSIYNTVSKHKSIILHLEVERGPGFVSICHSPTANHFNYLYITRKSTDIKAIPYTVSHTIQYIEK